MNQQQQQFDNDMSTFENPDLEHWTPPRILHYEDEQGNDHLYEFDPKNVVFGMIKSRPNNSGFVVPMEYRLVVDGRELMVPIMLQTPKMHTMWGLSSRDFAAKGGGGGMIQSGTRLDLTFRDKDKFPAVSSFYTSIFLLDQHILTTAKQRLKQWFPQRAKQLERQLGVIDVLYKAATRLRERASDHRMFSPSLTMKVRKLKNGLFNFNCFNEQLVLIPGDQIVSGADLISKFEITGLWFTDTSFGMSTELREVLLYKTRFRKTPSIIAPTADDLADEAACDAKSDDGLMGVNANPNY